MRFSGMSNGRPVSATISCAAWSCGSKRLRAPQLFRQRVGSYRLAVTERFPCAIYFIWDEANGIVSVRRVLHAKQEHTRVLYGRSRQATEL